MLTSILLVVGGLAVLSVAAEALLRGACSLARRMGVSELFIGLTVVSFGTSAPELVVSVGSALRDMPDITMGNVVGSNLFNLLVILGLSAVICPIVISSRMLRRDVSIKLAVTFLLFGFASDGGISRLEGICLFALLIVFIGWAYRHAVAEPADAADAIPKSFDERLGAEPPKQDHLGLALVMTVSGLAGLALGADLFLKGSVGVARGLGLSELVIGLTLVAAGTSMPEMFATLVAALRRKADVAVGNIIGSNIFNILGILGITAIVHPLPVAPQVISFDLPYLIVVSILSLPVFLLGNKVTRLEGVALVGAYVVYTVWLLQMSMGTA